MAGAGSDFFDAIQRYPVMLLDAERIFGRLEDDKRTQIAGVEGWCGARPADRMPGRPRHRCQPGHRAGILGITAAPYGAATVKDGRVEQSNFDNAIDCYRA
jgi:hypothetical protein